MNDQVRMKLADISQGNIWFVESFFDSSRHVGTSSVLHVVGINLVPDRSVQTTGYVEDIHFFLYIFQIFQSIFQILSVIINFMKQKTTD